MEIEDGVDILLEVTDDVLSGTDAVPDTVEVVDVFDPVLDSVDDAAVVDMLCCGLGEIDELVIEEDSVLEDVLAAVVDVTEGCVGFADAVVASWDIVEPSLVDVSAEMEDEEGKLVCSMLVVTGTDGVVVGEPDCVGEAVLVETNV